MFDCRNCSLSFLSKKVKKKIGLESLGKNFQKYLEYSYNSIILHRAVIQSNTSALTVFKQTLITSRSTEDAL